MNYYLAKYFSYATMKLELTPITIIEKVKMCTVKIIIIVRPTKRLNDGKLAVGYRHHIDSYYGDKNK